MFDTRKLLIGFTDSTSTIFIWSSAVSSNIPRILPGIGSPSSQEINSPAARHPNMIAHCLTIAYLNLMSNMSAKLAFSIERGCNLIEEKFL